MRNYAYEKNRIEFIVENFYLHEISLLFSLGRGRKKNFFPFSLLPLKYFPFSLLPLKVSHFFRRVQKKRKFFRHTRTSTELSSQNVGGVIVSGGDDLCAIMRSSLEKSTIFKFYKAIIESICNKFIESIT